MGRNSFARTGRHHLQLEPMPQYSGLHGWLAALGSNRQNYTGHFVQTLMWAGLILGVAAYGAVVVRNVTEMLVEISNHQLSIVAVQRPNR